MFKHYEQKTWKTNPPTRWNYLFVWYCHENYTCWIYSNIMCFAMESCIFCYSYFMFHYIPLNFLFYFSWFSLLQQISYTLKCLQQRCLWRKYKNPKHWYLRYVTADIITYPYQHRDPIIESYEVMSSEFLNCTYFQPNLVCPYLPALHGHILNMLFHQVVYIKPGHHLNWLGIFL